MYHFVICCRKDNNILQYDTNILLTFCKINYIFPSTPFNLIYFIVEFDKKTFVPIPLFVLLVTFGLTNLRIQKFLRKFAEIFNVNIYIR